MPYRRLPKTNQARLRSLQKAVGMGEMVNLYELSYSYELWEKARGFLIRYERALFENKQCSENQFNTSKKQQESARNARMYISHFIQVLNMCVVRNEIKKEQKKLLKKKEKRAKKMQGKNSIWDGYYTTLQLMAS